MELWRYYRILRKRKWLIIIGTIICVGIVVAFTFLRPQQWEAYTKVMERVTGDEKVNIYAPAYLYQLEPKIRLSNLTQLITSQTVLERSAQTLWRMGQVTDPAKILLTLNVRPIVDSMVLSIEVRSSSETEAVATADVIATEAMRFYNELNYGGAARSKRFIEGELPKAKLRLEEIREELRKFKLANSAVMLPDQTTILLQELSRHETALSDYEMQAQMASAKIDGLERELRKYPKEFRTASTVIGSNPVWQSLEIELAKQEIELQRMIHGQGRTAAHPEVETLQQQIAETRRKLAEAGESILSSTTESIDPIRDSIVQNYVMSFIEYASANAASSAIRETVATLKTDIEKLPEKQMRLAQLALEEERAVNTYALLAQKLDEATIKEQEAENISSLQIIDTAKSRPADRRKALKVILAVLLSPIFCSGVAFLLNYMDNTVKTPAEAEELLQLPICATVPLARAHSLVDKKYLPAIATSYQMLSTNLLISEGQLEGRTILVASAEPDVGRSSTAANLAITLARDGARVILVDSDFRQPAQHGIFGVENDRGLSNVLAGQLPLKDSLKPTSIADLLLLPSGPSPSNPVRLLRSPEMAKLVEEINDMADFVVFDSPAGITFADSTLLAALVRNVIIVYAAGSVPRGAEAEFRKRLEQVNANIVGAVLNMVRPEDSHGYYHFRSAYEELLRNGKSVALPGRTGGVIADETDSETGTKSTNES